MSMSMRMDYYNMDYYNTVYNRGVLYRFIKECFIDDYLSCAVSIKETSVFGLFLMGMKLLYGFNYFGAGINFEYSLIHIDKFIHIELFDNSFPRYIVIVEGCNVFKYDMGNKENGVILINRLFGKLRGRVNESNLL